MNSVAFRISSLGSLLPAIIVLSAGVGSICATYAIVYAVLLQPLPFPRSERIGRLWDTANESGMRSLTSRQFSTISATAPDVSVARYSASYVRITFKDASVAVPALVVSDRFFEVLGTPALSGSTANVGSESALVLSERLAKRGIQAQAGDSVHVDGRALRVAAVMPAAFWFPDMETGAWVLTPRSSASAGGWSGPTIIRIPGDVPVPALAKRLTAVMAASRVRAQLAIITLDQDLLDSVRTPLLMLQLTSVFVVVVALANATLLLRNRAKRRERLYAIIAAIGGTPRHIVYMHVAEATATMAVVVALSVGVAAILLLVALWVGTTSLPRFQGIEISSHVLMVTALVAFVTTAAAYTMPTVDALRAAAECSLFRRVHGPGREGSGIFVVLMALAFALTMQATLLSFSFQRFLSGNVGFTGTDLVGVKVDLPYAADVRTTALRYETVVRSLRASSIDAAFANVFPLFDIEQMTNVNDASPTRGRKVILAGVRAVSPSYYAVCGLQLLAGQFPIHQDDELRLVVNDVLAREVFGSVNTALGRSLVLGDSSGTIVGVTRAVQHRALFVSPRSEVYASVESVARFSPASVSGLTTGFLVASAGLSARQTWEQLEASVRAQFPEVKQVHRWRFRDVLWASAGDRPLLTLGAAFMAALGLALMGLGIYANLSQSVRAQYRAIGVRLAIGATPQRILVEQLKRHLPLVGAAISGGFGLSLLIQRSVATSVFIPPGVEAPSAGFVMVIAVLILGAVFAMSSIKPAVDAARVDPVNVLRTE